MSLIISFTVYADGVSIEQLDLTDQQWIELMDLQAKAQQIHQQRQGALDDLLVGIATALARPNSHLSTLVLEIEATLDSLIVDLRVLHDMKLALYSTDLTPQQQAVVTEELSQTLHELSQTLDELDSGLALLQISHRHSQYEGISKTLAVYGNKKPAHCCGKFGFATEQAAHNHSVCTADNCSTKP
ncbi:MAG: hypothetical protein ACFCBW_00725 [Candidatus Competibacterales bacterium]